MKPCDAFSDYLLGREFSLNTDPAALYAIFNSPLSSTSRVAKWQLALQPFRFTRPQIKDEEPVVGDKLSRIPWSVATPKAVDIIQLARELEVGSAGEEESDSDTKGEGDECFHVDNSADRAVILLAFDKLKEHQKGGTDCQSLAQWENATATPTRDELQASSPYLRVLA